MVAVGLGCAGGPCGKGASGMLSVRKHARLRVMKVSWVLRRWGRGLGWGLGARNQNHKFRGGGRQFLQGRRQAVFARGKGAGKGGVHGGECWVAAHGSCGRVGREYQGGSFGGGYVGWIAVGAAVCMAESSGGELGSEELGQGFRVWTLGPNSGVKGRRCLKRGKDG